MVEPPLYRLRGRGPFYVDVWLGEDPEDTDDDHGWGRRSLFREVAVTTSRHAALAVLRLCDVDEIHDWTQKGATWDMPVTKLEDLLSGGATHE